MANKHAVRMDSEESESDSTIDSYNSDEHTESLKFGSSLSNEPPHDEEKMFPNIGLTSKERSLGKNTEVLSNTDVKKSDSPAENSKHSKVYSNGALEKSNVDKTKKKIEIQGNKSSTDMSKIDSFLEEYEGLKPGAQDEREATSDSNSETSDISSEEWSDETFEEDSDSFEQDEEKNEDIDSDPEISDKKLKQRLLKKIAGLTERLYEYPNPSDELFEALEWLIVDKERKGEMEEARLIKKCVKRESTKLWNSKEYKEYVVAKEEYSKQHRLVCKIATDKTLDKVEMRQKQVLDTIRRYFEHWNRLFEFEGNSCPERHSTAEPDMIGLIEETECKILAFVDKCRTCPYLSEETRDRASLLDHRCDQFRLDWMEQRYKKFDEKRQHEAQRQERCYKLMTQPRYQGHGPVEKTPFKLMRTMRLRRFYRNNWWAKYVQSLHPWERQYTLDQAIMLRSYVTQKKYFRKYRKGNYKPKYKRNQKHKGRGGDRPRSPWKL